MGKTIQHSLNPSRYFTNASTNLLVAEIQFRHCSVAMQGRREKRKRSLPSVFAFVEFLLLPKPAGDEEFCFNGIQSSVFVQRDFRSYS